jgi:peptidoglycan DL-endopeptidase CwlO
MVTDRPGRRWWLLAAISVIAVVFFAPPAVAEPGEDAGAPATLKDQLDAANRGFLEAQTALEVSRKRQAELNQKLDTIQKRLADLHESANHLATVAYRNNSLRTASALLASVSPENFVDRATAVNTIATRNDRQLREYGRLQREFAEAKAAVDAEVATQEKQLAEMDKRKKDAEKAIAAVGGKSTGGLVSANSPLAKPAPRNSDGSWPKESCSIDDPTTGGCITARNLHALRQAQAAGFTRFVSCHRTGGGGEHPVGRACDYAAQKNGFGGVATGGDRTYGNNLAAFFVRNANALGVLYVIWFRQIWQVSSGWKSYSGANGDPASNHENHVHLSVL